MSFCLSVSLSLKKIVNSLNLEDELVGFNSQIRPEAVKQRLISLNAGKCQVDVEFQISCQKCGWSPNIILLIIVFHEPGQEGTVPVLI